MSDIPTREDLPDHQNPEDDTSASDDGELKPGEETVVDAMTG